LSRFDDAAEAVRDNGRSGDIAPNFEAFRLWSIGRLL
jgi:hypothetical protein